jgi:hypothetical protein
MSLKQFIFLPIRFVSVFGTVLAVALVLGACAEDPDIISRATGTFSYWPNADADELELGSDASECGSGTGLDEYEDLYVLSVNCENWFSASWVFPRKPTDVAAFPVGEVVPRAPTVGYFWSDEGRGYSPNWSESWMERCYLTNLQPSGEMVLREVTEEPVHDSYAAIAGTLRFETPEGCLSGEVDFEINFRTD